MTGRAGPLPALNGRRVAPAEIAEIVKRHITDMDAARAAVAAYLLLDREAAA